MDFATALWKLFTQAHLEEKVTSSVLLQQFLTVRSCQQACAAQEPTRESRRGHLRGNLGGVCLEC